ncbi:hypothetical protein KGQ72_03085 [Patescibacteria group bacterium]|nr:hypothetical protein [Patescibacteria group bacterium]
MQTYLRTSLFAALLSTLLVAPSLAYAQTPPPATPGSHPNAVPPTTAPTKPLAPTPLPNGSVTPPGAASPTATSTAGPTNLPPASSGNGTMLFALIGLGVLVLAGIGWFLISRRTTPPQTGIPGV